MQGSREHTSYHTTRTSIARRMSGLNIIFFGQVDLTTAMSENVMQRSSCFIANMQEVPLIDRRPTRSGSVEINLLV